MVHLHLHYALVKNNAIKTNINPKLTGVPGIVLISVFLNSDRNPMRYDYYPIFQIRKLRLKEIK